LTYNNFASFLRLLDQLEDLVEGSLHIPLTGRCIIDEDEFFEITNNIRVSLPRETKEMERILAQARKIKEEAEEEAKKIITKAQEYVSNLVKESEIVKKAEEEAREKMNDAEEISLKIRDEADEYAQDVLKILKNKLEGELEIVQRGLDELNSYLEQRRKRRNK
jgi:vacuolar-type H+-ATPase subunit H